MFWVKPQVCTNYTLNYEETITIFIRFGTDEKSVVAFWTESFTKLNGWNKDNNVLYLLDILAKSSLTRNDCHSYFMHHFADIYKVRLYQLQLHR